MGDPKNDALQSGENDPALGQDASEFGQNGQDVTSTGAKEDRDIDRDASLDRAEDDPREGIERG